MTPLLLIMLYVVNGVVNAFPLARLLKCMLLLRNLISLEPGLLRSTFGLFYVSLLLLQNTLRLDMKYEHDSNI